MYLERNMKIIERIFDAQTGETTDIERELTAAEIKYRKDLEKSNATEQAEVEAKAASRQAIADRLGLTADELQVLLG
jgi:hypothetical protein